MSRAVVVRRPNAFWWWLSRTLVLGFSRAWFRLRVEGREHWPARGPVLVVANHASYLDPPLVGISSPRQVLFLAQAGLARLGLARWWLSRVGVTLIDRSAPSKDALRLLADSLAAGMPVAIFPEGTRCRDGRIAPFKNGVDFLVRRTGAPVLPVGLDGSYAAMNRRQRWPRPRKLVVRFGAPWSPEQVLAPGGREALRREIGRLARTELAGDAPAAAAPTRAAPRIEPVDPIPSAATPPPGGIAPSSLPAAGDAPHVRRRQSS